jgi:hypothetical protein
MFVRRCARLFTPAAMLIVAPVLLGSTNPGGSFDERVLAAHNRERSRLGLAPLRWDNALAGSARGWAERLAGTNAFEHAPENARNPQGENLWAGTRGYYSPEAMVDAWIREKRFYKPGIFPYNSTSGNVADVGHYTQIIWRTTDRVGCARTTGTREDVLVCRYSDAGNYIGERPI